MPPRKIVYFNGGRRALFFFYVILNENLSFLVKDTFFPTLNNSRQDI